MNGWCPLPFSRSSSGSSESFTSSAAESTRTPATPRSNQKRRISSCSVQTSGWAQLRSGCSGANKCRYHSPSSDPRPRGAAEDRLPAVGRGRAVRTRSPPEPEPLPGRRGRPRCERLAEPGVLVRNVIRHEVDDRPHPELASFCDQRLGILERAECRVDRAIVDDVVARVGERRRIPRVEPERVHPERPEVGQACPDARQVADPVAVPIGEAPDVHLVDDRITPPLAVTFALPAARRCRRPFDLRHRDGTIAELTSSCKR